MFEHPFFMYMAPLDTRGCGPVFPRVAISYGYSSFY